MNNESNIDELKQAITDMAYGDDGLMTDYFEKFVFSQSSKSDR